MDQRFRKVTLIATVAAAILVLSNPAWTKKPAHAERIMKPSVAAKSKCPTNHEEEISKRIKKIKADEFIRIVSDRTADYQMRFVPMGDRVREYLKESFRSKRKEADMLKTATGGLGSSIAIPCMTP